MSIRREPGFVWAHLYCDGCDDDEPFDHYSANATEARDGAKKYGWIRVKIGKKFKDLCESCAAEYKAKKANGS